MRCTIPEPHDQIATVPPVQWTRWDDSLPVDRLSQMSTFGVGGRVREIVKARSEKEIIEAVEQADADNIPVLVLGGGSNILASETDFDGVVVRDMRRQIDTVFEEGCSGARIHVTAGTPWDAVVAYTVEHGWMGMEALSGIPGSAGAAIVQNIGAYGQEVAGVVAVARTFDRATKAVRTIFLSDMQLGYRTSVLKKSMKLSSQGAPSPRIWALSPRWIVLDVDFQLRLATLSEPVRYAPLARKLGINPGERTASADVRAAVLELRASKGMILDDDDRDTYSAGSFFVNPVLSQNEARDLPDDAPTYSVGNHSAINQIGAAAPRVPGVVKTSAAWLISHSGFNTGFGTPDGAALSSKHSLALTNQGNATGEDIAELAKTIKKGVYERFGISLEPEPVLIGLNI